MSGLTGDPRKRVGAVPEAQKRGDLDELSIHGRFVRFFVVCPAMPISGMNRTWTN